MARNARKVTRRDMMQAASLGAAAMALGSCSSAQKGAGPAPLSPSPAPCRRFFEDTGPTVAFSPAAAYGRAVAAAWLSAPGRGDRQ